MLQSDAHFVLQDDVLTRTVGDELVLLHLGSEHYFGLNAVGAEFVAGVEAHQSLGEIVRSIADRFEVEPATVEADLQVLIQDLTDAELLTTLPPVGVDA